MSHLPKRLLDAGFDYEQFLAESDLDKHDMGWLLAYLPTALARWDEVLAAEDVDEFVEGLRGGLIERTINPPPPNRSLKAPLLVGFLLTLEILYDIHEYLETEYPEAFPESLHFIGCSTATKAMLLAMMLNPTLVISDNLSMGLCGIPSMNYIAQNPATAHVRFGFISAMTRSGQSEKAHQIGAKFYIPMPFLLPTIADNFMPILRFEK